MTRHAYASEAVVIDARNRLRAGQLVAPPPLREPSGRVPGGVHAWVPSEDRTVCGRRVTLLHRFPERSWDAFMAPLLRCAVCKERTSVD